MRSTNNEKKKRNPHPLMSWDIISLGYSKMESNQDVKILNRLKIKFDWDVDLNKILANQFDAIVLTSWNQHIVWTSQGFERMTGYKKSFVLNKRPDFLQGVDTSIASLKIIRNALALCQPVSCSLLNYRKDGSTYMCHIDITPLFNQQNRLVHFIAFEKEMN